VNLEKVFRDCEDHLFISKSFSVQERILYYHLLRQSRLEGKEDVLVALLPLANALGIAETTVRECVRALHERGCLQIVERSRQGHLVRVPLPEEIAGAIPSTVSTTELDWDALDFFSGRTFLAALIDREGGKCFYCFKNIRPDNCELDHVSSRINGSDHSYKNVVVSCHDCNTTKQEMSAPDFVRTLFRKGVLSQDDLADRLQALDMLNAGQLRPREDLVRAAS